MKRIFIILILFMTGYLFAQKTLPPKIIKTTPEFGDWHVDPALKEVLIEFDQDMQPGFSVLNSMNELKHNGSLTWKTPRIFSIPVILEPDRLYVVPMNSPRYSNFKSTQGIPLNPTDLIFHTGRLDSKLLKVHYVGLYNKFCDYFLSHYSYKDVKAIDWKNEFNKLRNEIENSESDAEFGSKLYKVLRLAHDPHLSIDIKDIQFYAAYEKIVPINYNTDFIIEKIGNSKTGNRKVVLYGSSKKFGYLSIRSLNNSAAEDINFAVQQLKVIKELPNLIIDLRMNTGGNDALARNFVSNLISDSAGFEKVVVRSEKNKKFDSAIIHSIKPSKENIKYNGSIYVLIGPQVMSSAESFVLMLKQIPNVRLVGSNTFGSSGNPKEYKITEGLSVFIPSWQAYDLQGNLLEGKGIQPDIKLEFPEKDFTDSDPVFNTLVKVYIDSAFDKQARNIKPINFPVLKEEGIAKDFEGNKYKTVKIGDQMWMAENLKSSRYSDGTPIAGAHGYNNDTGYIKVYGCLYDWKTAMHESIIENNQGVCPVGWHIPSDKEWMVMIDYMGGNEVAGGKMKETGIDHWAEPNELATNEYGFTAIPAGRYPKHMRPELRINTSATWWSSTKADSLSAWSYTILNQQSRVMSVPAGKINRYNDMQSDAYSVRCVKDAKK